MDDVLRETSAIGAEYLGDIDPNGLAIPAEFSAKRQASGMVGVSPAAELYAWLIRNGMRRGRESALRSTSPHGIAWLPPELQEEVAEILSRGERIAQECLGYEVLLRDFSS